MPEPTPPSADDGDDAGAGDDQPAPGGGPADAEPAPAAPPPASAEAVPGPAEAGEDGEGPAGAAGPAASRRDRRLARQAERRRRRRRRVVVAAVSVVGLLVLLAGAAAGFLWYENNRIHRVHVGHLSNVAQSGAQKDVENILLIGSTTRCGLAQQNPTFGLCDQGVTGVNSDVVMILHLDPDHHRAAILSIPRDTFVPNARHDGVNKIDAALGDLGGPSQLIAAITDDFGIPIQHYVELNFDSFQGVVNALGGVRMYFPMPVYDAESTLYVPTVGCHNVNGYAALALVRARHLQYQPPKDAGLYRTEWPYDPLSDLARIRRDHEFLRVLGSAVAKRGLGNFVTDLQLINSLAGNLEVDQGFSTRDMASLVLTFHGTDPTTVPQYTLPVVNDSQGYYYDGGGYGDVVFPVEPLDRQVVDEFLGVAPGQDADGHALPAPGSFTVAVENASTAPHAGAETAAALRALGYQVTSVTDAPVPADVSETTVLYGVPADVNEALTVQSAINGLSVVGYNPGIDEPPTTTATAAGTTTSTIDVGAPLPPSEGADVVVVLGSNFDVATPPASPATGATSSTQATTTTTTSGGATGGSTVPSYLGSNPDLAPPSSATTSLEPWDPRSCTASGGEGP